MHGMMHRVAVSWWALTVITTALLRFCVAQTQPPSPSQIESGLQVAFGESITPNGMQNLACGLVGVSDYFTLHFAGVDTALYPDSCGRLAIHSQQICFEQQYYLT